MHLPGLTEGAIHGWAWAAALLIWTIPILASISLWQRLHAHEAGEGFRLGLIAGVLWVIWALIWTLGLRPAALHPPLGTLITLGLAVSVLWDWARNLPHARWRAADGMTIVLLVALLAVLLWGWAFGPTPRPAA